MHPRHDPGIIRRGPGLGPYDSRSRFLNDKFYPRGAIASFLCLVAVYGAIWYALYFVAVSRG
jgi:hypothetical protein